MSRFLLVFDLDGTLVDSAPDLRAALNQMLREHGRPALSLPQVKRMVGDGVPVLVARALAASGADPADAVAALPRFLEIYEANAVRLTRPYPKVPETLAILRRQGYRMAICTNKPQRATIAVVEGLGLSELFDGIAGGDRFPVKKPDPGHLLGLIGALAARAEASAMIGDNENDAAAARAAGLPLVLMRYGYARVDPESLAADALLDHFAELPRALARLELTPRKAVGCAPLAQISREPHKFGRGNVPMPHSSEDPPSDSISAETPSTRPTEGLASEPTSSSAPNPSAEDLSKESDPQGRTATSGDAPRSPPRRRRRRRPPRTADLAEATAASQGQAEQSATAESAPPSGDFPAAPSPDGQPRRRRRRGRGPRRDAGSIEAAGETTQAAASLPESPPNVAEANDGEPRQDRPHEKPRSRRRRRRPPRPAEASAAEADRIVTAPAAEGTPARAPQYRSAPYRGSRGQGPHVRPSGDERPRERGPIGDNRRSPDRRAGGRGAPGPNNRRQGRDRDAPSKRPEPRLYALESVVDRGFEDVVDAAEDNLSRRVHWTIIKRMVADQGSGKPISATYVLQRDGVDTEFPGLAAARAAANKTIVHPEKLTLSKAEHAAAKK